MASAQAASWHGVMDLYGQIDDGWTMIGGQRAQVSRSDVA
jgi:hypothetical protein